MRAYEPTRRPSTRTCTSTPNCPTTSTAPPGASPGNCRNYGFTVQTGIGGTGVVGVLANGARPTVLLRAELDALPIRENTGVDYASIVTMAADGHEAPVAHACGYDMHMSCLLGPIQVFDGLRDGAAKDRSQFYKNLAVPVLRREPARRPGDPGPVLAVEHAGRHQGLLRVHQGLLRDRLHRGPPRDGRADPGHAREDGQIVPVHDTGRKSAWILKDAQEIYYPGAPHGLTATIQDQVNADLLAFLRS